MSNQQGSWARVRAFFGRPQQTESTAAVKMVETAEPVAVELSVEHPSRVTYPQPDVPPPPLPPLPAHLRDAGERALPAQGGTPSDAAVEQIPPRSWSGAV